MLQQQELRLGDLFTGQLVRLAAKVPDDNNVITRWFDDAEFARQLDSDAARPYSIARLEKDDEEEKKHLQEGRNYGFMFHTLAEDKVIGFGGLWVNWNHQNGWIGIGIGEPDYRSKGYGTDAMRLLVNYGFRELGLYRVQLMVFSYNKRAIRCYEKVGFKREVIQRAALYRDSQRYDQYLMGILRPEWEGR